MKTIWIKQFDNYVVDAITFDANRDDYTPIDVTEMPCDIMCGCYQLLNDALVRDQIKHAKVEADRSAQNKLQNLKKELDTMLATQELTRDAFDKLIGFLE